MLSDPRNSRAVIVGTYQYDNLDHLPTVENNIRRLDELLRNAETWGLPSDSRSIILQPRDAGAVVEAVSSASKSATDTLLFYYAGHGLQESKTRELCLALVQSKPNAVHTTLPFDWLREQFLLAPAAKKVVILDCCYSARAFKGGMSDSALADDAETEGSFLLAAAAETKKAIAPPGESFTAFTGELLETLEHGIVGGPEFLDMTAIYTNVFSSMKRKARPLPQQRARNGGSLITLARNRAYATPELDSLEGVIRVTEASRVLDLAEALRLQARMTQNESETSEAILLYRRVLAELPQHADQVPLALIGLGDSLRLRSELVGGSSTLNESIQVLRAAVKMAPTGHPQNAPSLAALGNALRLRAQMTGDGDSMAEAIRVLRDSVEASSTARPDRASILLDLAGTLWNAAQITQDTASLDQATHAWEEASHSESAPTRIQIESTRRWGTSIASRGDLLNAAPILARAVRLLPQLASRQLSRADRVQELINYLGLTSDAAACSIAAGNIVEAVQLLEQGRNILLGQVLETRTDIELLRAREPALTQRFEELSEQLDDSLDVGHASSKDNNDANSRLEGYAVDRRHSLSHEWDLVIQEIRRKEGFESFLAPPSLKELTEAAGSGAIVVINVSQFRSDAVIIRASGIESISLPDLSSGSVRDHAMTFLANSQNIYAGSDFDRRTYAHQDVVRTLQWLWDVLAEPVFNTLDFYPGIGRVWWCPTGLLSLLPIHAAESGQRTNWERAPEALVLRAALSVSRSERPSSVLDCAVSSYTPSITSLIRSRRTVQTAHRQVTAKRMIAIAMPYTPGAPPLPGVLREAGLLRAKFQDVTLLEGPDATRASVSAVLDQFEWFHFSCHAITDLDHPTESGLVLHDGLLTVRDITRQRLVSAELAVLLGCESSRGAIALPDEAIHLASAFQLAGIPHVVGSLWPIVDEVASEFCEVFYEHMEAAPEMDPALALHSTTIELRSRYPGAPLLWAAMVHLGPDLPIKNLQRRQAAPAVT